MGSQKSRNDQGEESGELLALMLCGARTLLNFSARSRVVVMLWVFGQKLGCAFDIGLHDDIGSSVGSG